MFSHTKISLVAVLLVSTSLFVSCSSPKQALPSDLGTSTTSNDPSLTQSASDLINSGQLNNTANQTPTQAPTAPSVTSQTNCLNSTGFTPGFGGANNFSDFTGGTTSTTGTGTGTGTSTTSALNNPSGSQCLAQGGMSNQQAANIGTGTYNMEAICIQVAGMILNAMTQGNPNPNLQAIRAAGQGFMNCLQLVVNQQSQSANWTAQSQAGFQNANYNLNQFGSQLNKFTW